MEAQKSGPFPKGDLPIKHIFNTFFSFTLVLLKLVLWKKDDRARKILFQNI